MAHAFAYPFVSSVRCLNKKTKNESSPNAKLLSYCKPHEPDPIWIPREGGSQKGKHPGVGVLPPSHFFLSLRDWTPAQTTHHTRDSDPRACQGGRHPHVTKASHPLGTDCPYPTKSVSWRRWITMLSDWNIPCNDDLKNEALTCP